MQDAGRAGAQRAGGLNEHLLLLGHDLAAHEPGKPGHQDIAMANTMLTMPGPSAAAMAIARISEGSVSMRSVKRISASSIQRPK